MTWGGRECKRRARQATVAKPADLPGNRAGPRSPPSFPPRHSSANACGPRNTPSRNRIPEKSPDAPPPGTTRARHLPILQVAKPDRAAPADLRGATGTRETHQGGAEMAAKRSGYFGTFVTTFF